MEQGDVYIPSVDICAICEDSECDGFGCISDIDSNNTDDGRREQLQNWVRWGKAWEQLETQLAYAENRSSRTS